MTDFFFDRLPELMQYLPTLVIIALAIAFVRARLKTKKETDQAIETANRLNLAYFNVAEEMLSQDKHAGSIFLNLFSSWAPWAMRGNYKGVKVRIEKYVQLKSTRDRSTVKSHYVSDPTKTTYSKGVKYHAWFKTPLPIDIRITQKALIIAKMIGEEKMVTIGDEYFDQRYCVLGDDRDAVIQWLNTSRQKDALYQLNKTIPHVNVDSQGAWFYTAEIEPEYSQVQRYLDSLAAFIDSWTKTDPS